MSAFDYGLRLRHAAMAVRLSVLDEEGGVSRQTRWQLEGNADELYERYLVPTMFRCSS